MSYFNRTWKDPMSGVVHRSRLLTKEEVEKEKILEAHQENLMAAVKWNRSVLKSHKLTFLSRKGFHDLRILTPGVCMSHMDTEPCATCWVDREKEPNHIVGPSEFHVTGPEYLLKEKSWTRSRSTKP